MEPLVALAAVAVFVGLLVLIAQLFKHNDPPEDPEDQLTSEETRDLLSND